MVPVAPRRATGTHRRLLHADLRFDLVEAPDFEEAVFTGDLDPYRSDGRPGRDNGSH